jgi:DNA repair exonuclease SbcCD ATPase subunit
VKLISLKGRNIGLLKGDFEFEFDEALTVITGPIGCGKSTILTMIRASLTNTFPGNASSWASWGTPPQEACYFVATWRIGDKTLHIAKCLSGDKQFAALNIPRLRIEHDSGRVEEIASSREALERTLALIPVPANIIDGHLIVDQDSITTPVSSTAAKFKETIQILTRTNDLEKMRSLIRDVMLSVTVPDVEEPLKMAEQDVNSDAGEVSRQEKLLDQAQQAERAIPIADINIRLNELQDIKLETERRKKLLGERTSAELAIKQLNDSLNALQANKLEIENLVAACASETEEAKKALYSIDSIIKANIKIKALKEQEKKLKAILDNYQANVVVKPEFDLPEDSHIQEAADASNSAWQQINMLEKKIELAAKGQCPECGNSTSVCETDLLQMQEKLNDYQLLKQEVDQAVATMKLHQKKWAEYNVKAEQWIRDVEISTNKYEEIVEELDSLKDTPHMDDSIKSKYMREVAEQESRIKTLSRIESDLAANKAHLANQMDILDSRNKDLAAIPERKFDDNEHARLMKQVDDHLAVRMKISEIKGCLENAKRSLERSQSRLEAQKIRAAQVAPITKLRSILDKASSVLVKDGLPKLLSLQYMGKLNERLAFYLNTINADFAAYIDENLEFMARKADGLIHAAKRLSGGQKQQASVAYLLAVNDVFASTLGVLALDEPSGAMQESNSQDLAQAFSYLAKVGKQTGRQFIVITHSASLAAYGCKHIELEGV